MRVQNHLMMEVAHLGEVMMAVKRAESGDGAVMGTDQAESAARRAFGWIGSVAVETEGGQGWLEGGALGDDLYAGTAGVLFGCAEAMAAGLDTALVAAGARGRLLYLARQGSGGATLPDDGLFTGWAGVAAGGFARLRVGK